MAEEQQKDQPAGRKRIMVWSDDKDEILCREILLFEPYKFKVRSHQRGNAWQAIADNLNSLETMDFRVDKRAVRDRYNTIKANFEVRQRQERAATGISPEVKLLDLALEDIIQRENESTAEIEKENKKNEEERKLAESIRKEALETFAESKQRKRTAEEEQQSSSKGKKKSRSSGTDTLVFLQNKLEKDTENKEKELTLKKQQLDLEERKFQASQEHQNNLLQSVMQTNIQMMSMMAEIMKSNKK